MITPEDNIYLVGFSGVGKTVVGKLLAGRLRRRFVDMDAVIAERLGESIPGIFARYGEGRYRDEENLLVNELASERGLVVAAGGGAILDEKNYRRFEESGAVVALRASPEIIRKRLEGEEPRALLQSADPLARIRELKAERRAVYDKVPLQIRTEELMPAEIVDRVIELVGVTSEE
jgi:shikimate kinase